MRRRFPANYVTALANTNPVIAPVGEQGFLTPLGPTRGDPASFRFQCRCGEEVIRKAKDVRAGVKAGRLPRCKPSCPVALAEAAKRKGAARA